MVRYNESERCAHLIGAVFTVVMLSILVLEGYNRSVDARVIVLCISRELLR
jgi:hypothetical protein